MPEPARSETPAPRQFRDVQFRGDFIEFSREYAVGKGDRLSVRSRLDDDGTQVIELETTLNGRLLLHWGVAGGPGYKGGWRLPPENVQPEGTVSYKERALQTPWVPATTEGYRYALRIALPEHERSDALNFVVKDVDTNTWYDRNGDNYEVPLPGGETPLHLSMTSVEQKGPVLLKPEDQIPALPDELCGVWAYIKWEQAGCPNRSQQDADHEYQVAIREMKVLLRAGSDLDFLRKVGKGEIKYGSETVQKRIKKAFELEHLEHVLERRSQDEDEDELADGMLLTVEDVTEAVPKKQDKSPPPPMPVVEEPPAPPPQKEAPPPPPPPAAEQEHRVGDVGAGLGVGRRDPLTLIKQPPKLSKEGRARPVNPLLPLLEEAESDEAVQWKRMYPMGEGASLLVAVRKVGEGRARVSLTTDNKNDLVLHWGVLIAGKGGKWQPPPRDARPTGSEMCDELSLDTPFSACATDQCKVEVGGSRVPLQQIDLDLTDDEKIAALTFVVRSGDKTRWWKDGGSDFRVPLPFKKAAAVEGKKGKKDDVFAEFDPNDVISRTIVDCEVKKGAWTLMHRFNQAAELLEGALSGAYGSDPEDLADAMAKIFVWLRYSSTRQLTWQRNYNTQPRILSAAQGRLCGTIHHAVGQLSGDAQEWARMMLTCVGRGGNGQAIRDEILNIMHRHHIKEVKGTWMEEWHQKLHNNTTPDDVHICEAYIKFLECHGDNAQYWRVLKDAGITRERLEGYDRAIRCEPEYFPDKRDGLIHDLYNYLGILKAVHSGADLNQSIMEAHHSVPNEAKGYLGYVQSHLDDWQVLPLIEAALEARALIQGRAQEDRNCMYLDLALENVVRQAAERGMGASNVVQLVSPLLENLCLSTGDNEELCYCLKEWHALPTSVLQGRPSRDEALRATSVIDRIRRALAAVSERTSERIGGISRAYGNAFGCDNWAVELFAEEVVRGGPAFAVSLVLGAVEPELRKDAELGAWQVISPASVEGEVVCVKGLHDVQHKTYEKPTVLICDRVTGEEEIPDGAVAVLTPDAPDVLSHVAVRARNLKTLFATCYEDGPLEELKKLAGKTISMSTSAAGDVRWSEDATGAGGSAATNGAPQRKITVSIPNWCGKWAVGVDRFADGVVGAKSKNIASLRGKLPEWVNLPASVTIPFGSFEEALKDPANKDLAAKIDEAAKNVPQDPATWLATCRDLAMQVKVPGALREALREALAEGGGGGADTVADDAKWAACEQALKGVWASKFNDRAYYSCRKVGLNFMDVRMAVLVQRVVPAQYAFVLHTTNPQTNDASEVYGEMVRGLGEVLVSGMYPGRSLSFKGPKTDLSNPTVLSYPSKSVGLFVDDSLIFRSDSNGEDLEGYAGAGLYESLTSAQQVERRVDAASDPVVHDAEYRRELLSRVLQVGAAIEGALGSPQDVEGVVGDGGEITVVQTRPQM
ncbi:unnamed protein product [Pedinophyceae sp. YPF-701]|nr:unnamed protein product [Pedinophyceae sp. YPF-701]